MRVFAPALAGGIGAGYGALLAALFCRSGCGTGSVGSFAAIFGWAAAASTGVAAMVADDLFLAWKELPPEAEATTIHIAPGLGATVDGHPTFGLMGRF